MKYVCFDIGNVLCHLDFEIFLSALSQQFNISETDTWRFLSRTQKLHDLGLTLLKDEFADHFKLHSEVTIDDLLNKWNETIKQEELMFQLLSQLSENNVEIALLSNIGFEHEAYLNKIAESYVGYKKAIQFYSCNVGARKPSLLYYQTFLSLNPKFKGCLYVDDIQENLDTGKKFGFKTLRFALSELSGKTEGQTQHNIKTAVSRLKALILENK